LPQGYWLESDHVKIGLALGGGGARGLAHIPLLEVFDDLGIKPSLITGTSMGAIVAACYAGGMSGKDLRAHTTSLLSNRMDLMRHVFGARKFKPTDLLTLTSLTSLHLDGVKLADVAVPDHLPKNIEDTKIPLRIIACNFETRSEVVFSKGPMLQAVGASIAIPGIIAGPEINGDLHVDGGVLNPVPFDHARAGMDLVVAVDVTGRPRSTRNRKFTNIEIAVGSLLLMFSELAQLRRAINPPDIYIMPDVDSFGSGEFFRVAELLAAGDACKDELKRKLEARINASL
jgi:NTE family protein